MMKRLSLMLVFMGIMLTASTAFCQIEFHDLWSPSHQEIAMSRPLAMGRAFISIAEGNTAYFYNPAGMAQETVYSISVESEFEPKQGSSRSVAISVVDSATTVLCAQLGYTYHGYESRQLWDSNDWEWLKDTDTLYPDAPGILTEGEGSPPLSASDSQGRLDPFANPRPEHWAGNRVPYMRQMYGQFKAGDVHRHIPRVALGGAINRYVYMGVTGKYIYVQRPSRHSVNSGNVDIGLLFNTQAGVRIGLVGYNLIHNAYDLWPLTFGAGISYTWEKTFTIAYDQLVMVDIFGEREPDDNSYVYPHGTKLSYRLGLEYVIMGMVAIRAGYEYDDVWEKNHNISAGLAYVSDEFSINVGYSQALPHTETRLLGVGFSFNIP